MDVDVESVRRYLLEQTDLADRFPNWSSSVNLSQLLRAFKESQSRQAELWSEDEAEFARLEEVTSRFKRYYLWAIVALGLPGNLASLLTFLHMRSLGSCVVYVAVLAVVDSLALGVKLTLALLLQQEAVFSAASCKVLLFLANSLVVYANWIVVALAAERLVAVCRPLALTVYWTRSRAACGLAAVLLLSLLACVPVLVVSVATGDGRSCVAEERHRETAEAWHWVNVTLYGFLPCTALLACNVAILLTLRRARRQQHRLCNGHGDPLTPTASSSSSATARKAGSGRQRAAASGQRQASVILLVASFVLLVLTIPRCALLLMQQMWRPHDLLLIARVRVLNQVTYALSDLNHAVNFYLYFVSAKHFRRKFLDLFRSTKTRLKRLSTRETAVRRVSDSDWTRFVVMASRPCSPRNRDAPRN